MYLFFNASIRQLSYDFISFLKFRWQVNKIYDFRMTLLNGD